MWLTQIGEGEGLVCIVDVSIDMIGLISSCADTIWGEQSSGWKKNSSNEKRQPPGNMATGCTQFLHS